jgi:hypothetical protein
MQFASAADLACIKELGIPSYSHTARRAPEGGTVRAVVKIGPLGRAAKIETNGANPDLAEEVRNFLSEATTYKEGCANKRVELIFTFQLEGDPEWTPQVFVRFAPPNHFTIVSRPKKPNVN